MKTIIKSKLSKSSALAMLAVTCVISTACGTPNAEQSSSGADSAYPMTINNCGREVTIESKPERLYVIGGEAGTLVHSAGGAGSIHTFSPLIGEPLGEAAEALDQAEQQPIRTASEMSREMIIGAAPDLVVTFGLSGFDPNDLETAGIPTYLISGYCGGFGAGQSTIEDPLQGIFDDVEALGQILGTSEHADAVAEDMQNRVEAVREKADQSPSAKEKTAAFFVAGPDSGLGAYGNRSMIHQQMEIAGLTNVLGEISERYFEPSVESLIESAPERLIALYEPGDTTEEEVQAVLLDRPDLAQIPAVVTKDVLVLDFYYSGHGSLAVEGLEQLYDLIQTGNE